MEKSASKSGGRSRYRCRQTKHEENVTIPKDVNCLRSWLRGSPDGRELLGELQQEIRDQCRGRDAVLVMLHGDGYVEVYAERSVDVCLLQVPEDAPDEMIEELMPRPYRYLFWPVLMRKSSQCERITTSDMIDRLTCMELVDAVHGKSRALSGRDLGVVR